MALNVAMALLSICCLSSGKMAKVARCFMRGVGVQRGCEWVRRWGKEKEREMASDKGRIWDDW